MGHVRIIIA